MRRGQSTVEWMMIVSVLCVALTAAAYAFLPGFRAGIADLDDNLEDFFAQGETDGSGDKR